MPARTVEGDDGMRAGCDLGTDLGQMQVHRVAVGMRYHQSGADAAGRAGGAEQVGPARQR